MKKVFVALHPGALNQWVSYGNKTPYINYVDNEIKQALESESIETKTHKINPFEIDRSIERQALKSFGPTHAIYITPSQFSRYGSGRSSVTWNINVFQFKEDMKDKASTNIYRFAYNSTDCMTGTLAGQEFYKECIQEWVRPMLLNIREKGF